jgi:hypothetical protein
LIADFSLRKELRRKEMEKADLHIHTSYSWDGTCSVSAVLQQDA